MDKTDQSFEEAKKDPDFCPGSCDECNASCFRFEEADQFEQAMIGVLNETTGQIVGTYPLTPSGESKCAWFLRMIKEGNKDTFHKITLYRKVGE